MDYMERAKYVLIQIAEDGTEETDDRLAAASTLLHHEEYVSAQMAADRLAKEAKP